MKEDHSRAESITSSAMGVSNNSMAPTTVMDNDLRAMVSNQGAAISRIEEIVITLQRDMTAMTQLLMKPQCDHLLSSAQSEPSDVPRQLQDASTSNPSEDRTSRQQLIRNRGSESTTIRGSFTIDATPIGSPSSPSTTADSLTVDANDKSQPVAAVDVDTIALQKRTMREKREAAIIRKKQEEEKEELQRKRHIRLKMEHLGLTDETMRGTSRQAKSKPSPPAVETSSVSKPGQLNSTQSSHTLLQNSIPAAHSNGISTRADELIPRYPGHQASRLPREGEEHQDEVINGLDDLDFNPKELVNKSTAPIPSESITADPVQEQIDAKSPDIVATREDDDQEMSATQEYLKTAPVDGDPDDMDYESSGQSSNSRDEPASLEVASSMDRLLTPAHPTGSINMPTVVDEQPGDMEYELSNAASIPPDEPAAAEVASSVDRLLTPVQPSSKTRDPVSHRGRGGRPRKRSSLPRLPTPEWEKDDRDPDAYAQKMKSPLTTAVRRRAVMRKGVSGPMRKSFSPVSSKAQSPKQADTPGKQRDKKGFLITASGQRDGRSLRRGQKREPGDTRKRDGSSRSANTDEVTTESRKSKRPKARERSESPTLTKGMDDTLAGQKDAHDKLMAKVFPKRYR